MKVKNGLCNESVETIQGSCKNYCSRLGLWQVIFNTRIVDAYRTYAVRGLCMQKRTCPSHFLVMQRKYFMERSICSRLYLMEYFRSLIGAHLVENLHFQVLKEDSSWLMLLILILLACSLEEKVLNHRNRWCKLLASSDGS